MGIPIWKYELFYYFILYFVLLHKNNILLQNCVFKLQFCLWKFPIHILFINYRFVELYFLLSIFRRRWFPRHHHNRLVLYKYNQSMFYKGLTFFKNLDASFSLWPNKANGHAICRLTMCNCLRNDFQIYFLEHIQLLSGR